LQEASKIAEVDVNVTWEPFFLNRNTPEEGEDLEAHIYKKYGTQGLDMINDPNTYLYVAGRKVGIDFLKKRNVYPTAKAHSLMEYAKEKDNDTANKLMEELFHRYFEKGDNISSEEVLATIASKVGIEESAAKDAMQDEKFQYDVQQKDQLHKQQMKISGVPFFVIERKDGKKPVGFSGAQPIDIMAEQLEEAADN
jgi:predicted DsbA family dithiol-disulfide isomerase